MAAVAQPHHTLWLGLCMYSRTGPRWGGSVTPDPWPQWQQSCLGAFTWFDASSHFYWGNGEIIDITCSNGWGGQMKQWEVLSIKRGLLLLSITDEQKVSPSVSWSESIFTLCGEEVGEQILYVEYMVWHKTFTVWHEAWREEEWFWLAVFSSADTTIYKQGSRVKG